MGVAVTITMLFWVPGLLFSWCAVGAEFIKGTNYGNMFVPEDWMAGDGDSIYGSHYGPAVQKPWDVDRFSLCDVTDDRILRWLDDKVKESDFQKLQSYGVKLLRVPTGYWNWVDIGGATPNAPDNVAARFRNLQAVKPSQYSPYIDKIYQWAEKYGIKVLMELHGAPGSQNGEIHSGCVTGAELDGGKPEHYFNTDWNKQIAVDSVGKMAEKCQQYGSTCWGIGVLNEPQPSGGGHAPTDEDLPTSCLLITMRPSPRPGPSCPRTPRWFSSAGPMTFGGGLTTATHITSTGRYCGILTCTQEAHRMLMKFLASMMGTWDRFRISRTDKEQM